MEALLNELMTNYVQFTSEEIKKLSKTGRSNEDVTILLDGIRSIRHIANVLRRWEQIETESKESTLQQKFREMIEQYAVFTNETIKLFLKNTDEKKNGSTITRLALEFNKLTCTLQDFIRKAEQSDAPRKSDDFPAT